ncbi:MAG: hypothetical protein ROO71_02805 [Balneola sp.]
MSEDLEYRVEQFLRFPKELSREEYAKMEQLIKHDVNAREIAEWLGVFYDELDQINKPAVIQLHPKSYDPKTSGPMVLAAMTSETLETGLATRAVFAAEEHHTLLRILEDRKQKAFQFHVISKYVGTEDRVLVEIQEPGLEFVTAKGGSLKNIRKKELSDLNWDEAFAMVRVPSDSCTYNPENHRFSACERCSISTKNDDCFVDFADDSISRLLVVQNDETELYYRNTDSLKIKVDITQPFSVYLYF